MILPAQLIEAEVALGALEITPFFRDKKITNGLSYGLSSAGYDIRLSLPEQHRNREGLRLLVGQFLLASAIEQVSLPDHLLVTLMDKSTNARRGLSVFNTVFEPGWRGYPTLELYNAGSEVITLHHGQPIAQMLFHQLAQATDRPYVGKYQDQPAGPVSAITEV